MGDGARVLTGLRGARQTTSQEPQSRPAGGAVSGRALDRAPPRRVSASGVLALARVMLSRTAILNRPHPP
jgi:hypothetical protein